MEVVSMEDIVLIGRQNEYERLNECLKSAEPQLIGIYGRRRVGKTFLINNFFNGRFDFKITGIYNKPAEIQLESFITEYNSQTQSESSIPKNWMEAFALLKSYILTLSDKEKQVVFFGKPF